MAELGPRILAVTSTAAAEGAEAEAAALAVTVALERPPGPGLLLDLAGNRRWRPTVLAAAGARALAGAIGEEVSMSAVARGHICVATPVGGPIADLVDTALRGLQGTAIVHVGPREFRETLDANVCAAVLLRTGGRADAPLAAALAIELRRRRVALKVWGRPLGLIQGRRALAGLDPGAATVARARRLLAAGGAGDPVPARGPWAVRRHRVRTEAGQALPAMLGLIAAVALLALALIAVGGGITAKGRAQRAADLAALSAGRSMRDDLPRLFEPPRVAGRLNPRHLDRIVYLERASAAAREAAAKNGLPPRSISVEFPDRASFAPLRVRVVGRPQVVIEGGTGGARVRVEATAATEPPLAGGPPPTTAGGGGYDGPLAYRQGKPMRPDVAAAFDRVAQAAARHGISLTINSAFRSDAEQAALFAAHPDPRWVAPPGRSLHRCGTELDLGPAAAYGWLATHAPGFGFVRRYSWEPWHFGFVDGPAPCSAVPLGAEARSGGDGRTAGGGGLPAYVPGFIRGPLVDAASRHGVSAALLAAQLMAESNFNPAAVSSAGARGIAQFMPATAAAYGLGDPLDPVASVDAQARLMADLLRQFGSTALALAAYNAGPGAVSACGCVPAFPETTGYVARILALVGSATAGQVAPPAALEVRLIA